MVMPPDTVKEGDLGVAVVCEDASNDAEWERMCCQNIDLKANQDDLIIERYSTEVTTDDEDGSRVLIVVGHLAEESR